MFNKILVPYDGSEHAKHAVEAAIQLADTDKPVTITVLSIADVSNADDTTFEIAARLATTGATQMQTPADTMMEEREKEVAEEVAQIAPELPINVELKTIVKSGQPQSAIVNYANYGDYDCICMGRRGLGAIASAFGSVSYAVLRGVELPVMVVK